MRRTDGRLRLGLTDAGKVVLRGTGFVALAALIVPAFGVLSALVSVVLMALLVGFVLRPKIHVSGNLPDRIIVGQTVRLRYVLKNVSHLPTYNLCARFYALPEAIEQVGDGHMVSRLGPGVAATTESSSRFYNPAFPLTCSVSVHRVMMRRTLSSFRPFPRFKSP